MRLLVDISSILHRAAHKMDHLSDRHGNRTNVVFGTLRSLGKLAGELEPTELVVCWDGGNEKRTALYPAYKAGRERDPEWYADYRRQVRLLAGVLEHLPVIQIWQPRVEADDAIAVLAKFLSLERVGIVTGDEDLYQLASPPRQQIYHPTKRAPIRLELEPQQYLWLKVLVGDPSDSIRGVDRVGAVTAKKLLREHGSLDAVMRRARDDGQLGSMTYARARAVVDRNVRLMKLDGELLTAGERASILDQYRLRRLNCKLNRQAFRNALKVMGMTSLIIGLSRYLLPFWSMEREGGNEATKARAEALRAPFAESGSVREEVEEAFVRKLKRPIGEAIGGRAGGGRPGLAGAVGGAVRHVGQGFESAILADPGRSVDDAGSTAIPAGKRGARAERRQATPLGSSRAGRDSTAGVQTTRPRDESRGYSRKLRRVAPTPPKTKLIAGRRELRRAETLSVLQNLQNAPDFQDWIKRQPTRELRRLRTLISTLLTYPNYIPSKIDTRWLARVHETYSNEEPEWMKSKHRRR